MNLCKKNSDEAIISQTADNELERSSLWMFDMQMNSK